MSHPALLSPAPGSERDTLSLLCSPLVFSAPGNSLALCLACHKGKTVNSTDVSLAHLAVSDFLFTLALPGRITYYVLDSRGSFGDGLCRLTAFLLSVNTPGAGGQPPDVHEGTPLPGCGPPPPGPAAPQGPRATARLCGSLGLGLAADGALDLHPHDRACGSCGDSPGTLADEPGRTPAEARLLTLALLVAVAVVVGPYHLDVIQFMLRGTPRPPSCPARRAFRLSLQLTRPLMDANCGSDPIIYYFASTRYGKWLVGILKLRGSASSSSSQGRASSEAPSVSQTGALAPLEENEV
ncbi:hypothetical protein GH733_006527 [Mirounga leonina]|nr:hypothetical protein GH733_006527 [Mirounga leonina]